MSNYTKKIFIKILFLSCLVLFCYPQTHVWANGIFLPEFVPGTFPPAASLQEVSKAVKEKIAADRCVNPQNLKISGDRVPEFPDGITPIFAGHPLDPATGMYNARARNYDPNIGRFTTQDPLSRIPMPAIQAFAGNPYVYVRNSPQRFTDPLGLYEQPTNNAYDPYNSYSDPTPMNPFAYLGPNVNVSIQYSTMTDALGTQYSRQIRLDTPYGYVIGTNQWSQDNTNPIGDLLSSNREVNLPPGYTPAPTIPYPTIAMPDVPSPYSDWLSIAEAFGQGVAEGIQAQINAYQQQAVDRYWTQIAGGAGPTEAYLNTIAITLGDPTGATSLIQGISGIDLTSGQYLSGADRLGQTLAGAGQLILTGIGIGGAVEQAAQRVTTGAESAANRALWMGENGLAAAEADGANILKLSQAAQDALAAGDPSLMQAESAA